MKRHYCHTGFIRPAAHTQRGVSLIVALIFLTILALLGITAARNSIMEERMAGNTRDRALAFQAAEAALKGFEVDLADGTVDTASGYFDRSNCTDPAASTCYLSHANGQDYWNSLAMSAGQWADATAKAFSAFQTNEGDVVAKNPRYIVERIPNSGTMQRYRVTARGVGKSTDTVVILQAEYTYTP
jgi:type IV pilus assembly protein PilX